MKITLVFFALLISLDSLCQVHSSDKKIKIKRAFNELGELKDIYYYDTKGREIMHVEINERRRVSSHFYEFMDTVVTQFVYDSVPNMLFTFEYVVNDNVKSQKRLKITETLNEEGKVLIEDYAHPESIDNYFSYDKKGNIVKDSSRSLVLLKTYSYSFDSIHILEKSTFQEDVFNQLWRNVYEYDSLGRLEKGFVYNNEDQLAQITSYSYNENDQLTYEETKFIDLLSIESEKFDKISSYKYKYDSEGCLIQKIGVGQWDKPKTTIFRYEFY